MKIAGLVNKKQMNSVMHLRCASMGEMCRVQGDYVESKEKNLESSIGLKLFGPSTYKSLSLEIYATDCTCTVLLI